MSQNDRKIARGPASLRGGAAAAFNLPQFSPAFNRNVFWPMRWSGNAELDKSGIAVYAKQVHAVIETPSYLADAKAAGVSDDERDAIVNVIASNPLAGVIIPGSGGARKVRVAGKGKGKSGAYRVIAYYAAEDVPVFLLALVSKGQRADISLAERNAMRGKMPLLVDSYRAGARARAKMFRRDDK